MSEAPRRKLGIVEALNAVRDQCPSGAVRRCAETALEALKAKDHGALVEQAHFVLMASQGWRGERADQVRMTLQEFVSSAEASRSSQG